MQTMYSFPSRCIGIYCIGFSQKKNCGKITLEYYIQNYSTVKASMFFFKPVPLTFPSYESHLKIMKCFWILFKIENFLCSPNHGSLWMKVEAH